MAKVMVTIKATDAAPTTEAIQRRHGLADDEIDRDFGVIDVDPDEHLYTILVEERVVAKLTGDPGWEVRGPYSNPRIAPFGLPQPGEGS